MNLDRCIYFGKLNFCRDLLALTNPLGEHIRPSGDDDR